MPRFHVQTLFSPCSVLKNNRFSRLLATTPVAYWKGHDSTFQCRTQMATNVRNDVGGCYQDAHLRFAKECSFHACEDGVGGGTFSIRNPLLTLSRVSARPRRTTNDQRFAGIASICEEIQIDAKEETRLNNGETTDIKIREAYHLLSFLIEVTSLGLDFSV